MPYATVNNTRFHYLDEGSAPGLPLVFLHGFTLDHRMFRHQVEFFKDDYRVIVPDAKGHGLSDAPTTNYSRRDRVHDLKGLLDTLAVDRCHLVGVSMGGSTGIGMALEFPEHLASLTLISTGAAGYSIGKKIDRIDQIAREDGLEAARAKWREFSLMHFKGNRTHLRDEMAQMIDDHSGAIWMDKMRGRYPREYDMERLDRIDTPALIISGAMDKVFTELADKLSDGISNSCQIVYPDVGHLVNLEVPSRLNRDLKVFLEQASSSVA